MNDSNSSPVPAPNDGKVMLQLSHECFQLLMVSIGSVLNSAKWTDHYHATMADCYDKAKIEEANFLASHPSQVV